MLLSVIMENDRAWLAAIFDLRRLVGRGSVVGQERAVRNLRRKVTRD